MTDRKKMIGSCILAFLLVAVVFIAGCTENEKRDKPDDVKGSLLPSGSPTDRTITLAGLFEKSSVTVEEIAGMEDLIVRLNATKKDVLHNYIGVDLFEFLVEVGVKWGAGTVKVEATDGFANEFNFHDLYYGPAKLDQDIVLLALAEDGQWFEDDTVLSIVAPSYEGKAGVKDITKITVDPWTITVNGSVLHELNVTVTDLPDENEYVQHSFTASVPGKGSRSVVGIAVSDLLLKAGTTLNTSEATVRISAADGLYRDFAYDDVLNNPESTNPMVLAHKVGGGDVPPENGAVWLVVPDDNYEDDNTNWFMDVWVKAVISIEVR